MYVWRVWLVWLVCVCIASLWNASALRGSWRLWRKELRLSALWSPVGAPSVDAFSLYTPSQKGLYTPGKISSGEDIEEDSLPDTGTHMCVCDCVHLRKYVLVITCEYVWAYACVYVT
jgi:hypothetical protein